MFYVKIFSDPALLYQAAFDLLRTRMMQTASPVLGLATGSTPVPLYERMVDAYQRGELSFSNTITFNLDEYVGLSKQHPQSYHYFMKEHLFSKIDLLPENIFLPSGDNSLSDPCDVYERQLAQHQIDLQILGIGSNGHIAFNEPGTDLGSKTHFVQLQPSTIHDNCRFFSSIEEVPTKAITMGIQSILQAKSILLIATGRNKASAVRQMLYGKLTPSLPASSLQLHPNVTVLLDTDAASFISDSTQENPPILAVG